MTPAPSPAADEFTDHIVSAVEWRRRGDDAERAGRLLDAVEALTRANHLDRDVEVERRLVVLRHAAFAQLHRGEPPRWPVVPPGPLSSGATPPVIEPAELSPQALSSGILGHGCLHVRGLLSQDRVRRLVEGIDRAIAAHDACAGGRPATETTPWFEPFKPGPGYTVGLKRKWVRDAGGVWAADSPRLLFELVETVTETGLGAAIEGYLGERPAMSVNKCTLRRVGRSEAKPNWHQDGAFLGDGIRTVNVWIALSDCGVDAPGLDIVPRRLDGLAERGTDGAVFDWAVGDPVVQRAAGVAGTFRPTFTAGDVLLFDELLLHNTAIDDSMVRERYAVEAWFFAPSVYPQGQIPLVY